jgi:proline-specific peptidase
MVTGAVAGQIPFRGYETSYRIIEDRCRQTNGKLPVLMLHGGPGGSSDSFEPLEQFADTGRQVILYDQVSCGDSEGPEDPSLWTVSLFLDQLASVRRQLAPGKVHLLGHSWGGMLALEYALMRPAGLVSLTLVGSTPAASLTWEASGRSYERLPEEVRKTLLEQEAVQTFEAPEYKEAAEVFSRRHVLRLDPRPAWWDRANERFNTALNVHMWAPPDGELFGWDVISRLPEIDAPTFIVAGSHDGATAGAEAVLREGMPGSELAVFEESSHYPFAEEPERFLHLLDDFLSRVERASILP